VKFGIVGPFSGGSALNGVQWKQGIDAWLALNSDTINGRKIEIIYRDTASGNPAVAKQLSQELLVQDKVDVLGGYALSPEAAGVAPLIDETKTPTLLFHVASPVLALGGVGGVYGAIAGAPVYMIVKYLSQRSARITGSSLSDFCSLPS
jgi:branched-chain amino acid transport system substrate-binding protein